MFLIPKYSKLVIVTIILIFSHFVYAMSANNDKLELLKITPEVREFIRTMVIENVGSEDFLRSTLSQARVDQRIITMMDKAFPQIPYPEYRRKFLNPQLIENGFLFYKKHSKLLEHSYNQYGVDPFIVVAIMGIESNYGDNQGQHGALNSLATLAFHYPRRSKFFKNELKAFLALCSENNLDPFIVKSSFAGALGAPQFMPSSYLGYARTFETRKNADLFLNRGDGIASISNYLSTFGWAEKDMRFGNKKSIGNQKIKYEKVCISDTEHNLQKNNYRVLLRYNNSHNYVKVVFELARKVASLADKK
ncbi:MAG: lytic murein transglycosylase [Oligoflexales bacterium]